MVELIRAFIAIELDDETRRTISEAQAKLKREDEAHYLSWLPPENFHITLRFLGNVETTRTHELAVVVAQACNSIPPFILKFGGVNAYWLENQPVAIVVNITGDVPVAQRLVGQIEDACVTLGYERREAAFNPHLTLATAKRDSVQVGSQMILKITEHVQVDDLGRLNVSSVSIMKNELMPGNKWFTRVAEIQLAK